MARALQPIPVHALDDPRIHLALPQMGRLAQGRLKTLCGRQAVSALPLFAVVEPGKKRCPTCFGKIDEHGALKPDESAEAGKAARAKSSAGGTKPKKATGGKAAR